MSIGNIEQKIRYFSEITPNKIAIEFGQEKVSYLQLDEITSKVANFLIYKNDGIKNVFIMTERGPSQIEALIGVVKSGGIFIPVDPNVPDNRIITMLQEVPSNWIITTSTLVNRLNKIIEAIGIKINVLLMESTKDTDNCTFANLNIFSMECINKVEEKYEYSSNKHCYVYFTSGSTGKPKGVLGRHRSLMQFIEWEIKEFGVNMDFRVSQLTSPSFDPFLRDVFVPLCAGATLCIPDNQEVTLNPIKLIEWIEKNHITLIHTVPSVFKMISNEILNPEKFSALKYILLAGEILRGNDIKKFIDMFGSKVQLVNLYGPTETTLAKLFYRINESDKDKAIIPVGKPIDFTDVLILNENLEICSTSIVGEIYIRTPFISSGYCNDKELTKKVFFKNPFTENPKDIIYKTGDFGRMFSDGNVEIVGRADNQVKIRGMRIELGEIENRLLQHSAISETVVMAKEDEDTKYLCAYMISHEKLEVNELRKFLLKCLPEYMVPSHFIQVDKMPLTASGKIDRKKLLNMQGGMESEVEYIAPKNEIEEKLVEIWGNILKRKNIGVQDNFFEIGGHSLKAARLLGEIHKVFSVEMSFAEFFKSPIIRKTAEYIEKAEKNIYVYIEKIEEREYYPVSSAQKRMFILNKLNPENTNYNLPIILKVKGKLNTNQVEMAMYNLILRHESLRTSFHLIDGEIVQKIDKEAKLNIKYSSTIEKNLNEVVKAFIKPFNLKINPLFRLEIVTLSEENYALMFDIHHIISDGTSTGIFIQEFLDLYQGKELADLKIQYKDYSAWENKLFESNEMKKQEEFWLEMFKEEIPTLNMPLDFSSTGKQISNGNRINFQISKEIVIEINDIAKKEGTTLNIVLFSIYNLLLSQYTGQNDITTGVTVAGRKHPDLDRIIGVFINFLPIRSKIDINSKFNDFLQAEKELIVNAYDNQNYPFDEIVARVGKKQDNSRNPIFNSMFILHNQHDRNKEFKVDGLEFHSVQINRDTSKLDFQMDSYVDYEGKLIGSLEYNTNLFKEETMKEFIKHFNMLIEMVVEDRENKLIDMCVFSEEELQIIEKKRYNNLLNKQELHVVITSTFTDEPIGGYVKWWCNQFNNDVSIKFAPYNQVFQQLLDTSSLISKNIGINIVLVRFEDWIRDVKSEEEKYNAIERNFNDLVEALRNQKKESTYLIGIFPVSTHLSLSDKLMQYIQEFNCCIKEALKDIKNMYVIDFCDIHKLYSINEVFDAISDKEGHIPFTDEYYAAIGTTIARKICAIRKPSFKVIVLDCDNTLWKGICGEDGALGVRIEEPYKEFQRFLIQKHDEGMLLVLCSKNNEKDVLETFDKNTEMLIKKEHLAAWRINWKNKTDNIKELAKELNLALDSFIFIDDSVLECSQVMINCPEVLTLQLPLDYKMIPMYIRHIWAFDREKVTKEDENRTQMYLAEKERKSMLDKKGSIDNFLESLQLKMSMNLIKDENITRVSQLTQRTNQFNLSTIRRTEDEIVQLIKNKNIRCWVVEVADRFGEYGLVGLIIAEKKDKILLIDTFLLSCRVLGRGIDDAMLSGIGRYCESQNIKRIEAKFYPTVKNKPFKDFIQSGKWKKIKETYNYIQYELDIQDIPQSIDFIECYYDSSYKKEIENVEHDSSMEVASDTQAELYAYPMSSDEDNEINWEAPIVNKENLVHLNQLVAVNNNSGVKLLKLPIYDKINSDLIIRKKYEAPRNELEEKLVKIWSEVLKVDNVGISDNFFDLGGHSLKAISLVSKVHKKFDVEIPLIEIFKSPTIKEISTYIGKAEKNIYAAIESVAENEYYEVSSAQKRMYMLQQFDQQSTGYNMPGVMLVEGRLEVERLEKCFDLLIKRHETLRTSFETIEDKIVQRVNESVNLKLESFEIGGAENQEEAGNIIKDFIKAFDLSKAPLLRVGLIRLEEEKHILMFDMHHIISDGVSMGILINEFVKIYEGNKLEQLRIQYKDYSQWQNNLLKSQVIQKQKEYWINRFKDEIPVLNMREDYARPLIQSFEGDSIKFKLDKELTKNLNKIAKETGSTMYMILLSGINILLSKYSGQEDIIIGSPIAGRPHADLEKIIGMFVNTLAMRNQPYGNKTYEGFLKEVKENALKAYENQEYQFDELVDNLNIPRDISRNPLFDVMFAMQNMESGEIKIKDLVFKGYKQEHKVAKFDLTFSAGEMEENIIFNLQYSTKLYKRETIERMAKHFVNILNEVSRDRSIKLSKIDMLTEEEKYKLLYEFNNNHAEYPIDVTINEIFEEQVEKTPDNIAIVFESKKLTYRELNEKANKLARTLREKGVKPDSIVGIMVERSLDMIVGIMAIIKAGGAYLPIDPKYPEARIKYMLEDGKVGVLLIQNKFKDKVTLKVELLDLANEKYYIGTGENLDIVVSSTDLAYVIYTSGSTGMPKGVMIEHKNVLNLVFALLNDIYSNYGVNLNVALVAPYVFDASVQQIFTSILLGHKLFIVPEEVRTDGELLLEYYNNNSIDISDGTPVHLNMLVDAMYKENIILNVKNFIIGGDVLNCETVRKFLNKVTATKSNIVNIYGPTECCVDSIFYKIDMNKTKDLEIIPIGKPMCNEAVYILGKNLEVIPIGSIGEIYISGNGIGRGYLNKSDLTAERFIENPFLDGQLMYKTGDLARWLPDGNIEFVGRIDNQVKIRGFRIELGEIENELLTHEYIKEIVVIDREDENKTKYLCAYLVSEKELTVSELRNYLSKKLPEYMIPSYFVRLDKMPLSPNGKIDRKVLPKPDGSIVTGAEYEAPRNEVEEKLVTIWSEILGVRKIGINDNFFELGGHSLKASILVSKIHKELNVEVSLREIFKAPSIKEISKYIAKTKKSIYASIEIIDEKEYYEVSSAQKRMYMLQQFDLNSTGYNMPGAMLVEGKLDVKMLEKSFAELITRHETLRTSFETVEDKIVQRVNHGVNFKLEHFSVKCIESVDKEVDNILKGFVKAFHLSEAPLLRIGLIKLEEFKHILMFDMHHIISDGLSMGILINEFVRIYEGDKLDQLRIQYKDYSEWQNNLLKSVVMEKQKEYWINRFKDEIPVLNMPIDYVRPLIQSFEGENISFKLDKEITKGLKRISKETGSTMYMVLLSGINILLSKYSGQEDIVIGTPIAGRPHADLEKIIGIFVNTLAMRNHPNGSKTYEDFLKEVKENALKAYENQDYQFDELVDKLNITRDISRNPLFDVMFTMQSMDSEKIELKDLVFKGYKQEHKVAKFDLTFSAIDMEDNIMFNFQYSAKLYKRETIERMVEHFVNVLKAVSKDIKTKISEIEILTEKEKSKLLYKFNNTYMEYPREKTIHELFEEQVEKTPNNIAVIFEDKQLTYSELNNKANKLARILREKGVKPNDIVVIMVERSLEMIVGIIAILKAGGAYLPIDPTYPNDRIDYMVCNSETNIIISQKKFIKQINFNGNIIDLEDEKIYMQYGGNLESIATSNSLAYLIYTSGSTGMPKGVMIEHKSIINTLLWRTKYYNFDIDDVVLQIPSFSFDSSVEDIFTPLLSGAKIVLIVQDNKLNLQYIKTCIKKNNVGYMLLVPSFYRAMLNEIGDSLVNMKGIIVAGENFDKSLAIEHYKKLNDVQLYNEYGPTENSVCTSVCKIQKDNINILIGEPINNVKWYILGKDNKLQPIGIPGEICISGEGLARGYLNNTELTVEKFVESPFVLGERMYKTGDLGKWTSDGSVEFLGRIDHQVKIRGFRIELGEIESQLLDHELINEAIVIDREEEKGSKYLCAYLVSKKELTVGELREHLLKKLPEYMIPSYFVQLDKFPLSPNGKVDRKVLPKLDESMVKGVEYEAPRNEVEEKLVAIWKEVLCVERIGINDNFFELGGHSLKATILVGKINNEFNVEVPLNIIFRMPTIKEISKCILNKEIFNAYKIYLQNEVVTKLNDTKLKNIFVFPPILGYGIVYNEFAKYVEHHTVYSFDFIEEENRIDEYVKQIVNIQKEGKYTLMGYSAGGNLAFEVAKELEKREYEVEHIILLDSVVHDMKYTDNSKLMKTAESILDELNKSARKNAPFIMEYINTNVQRKLEKFAIYFNEIINDGCINANIHLILSSFEDIDEKNLNSEIERNNKINRWGDLTKKCFNFYQGYGDHSEMVYNDNAKLNGQILNQILI